MNETGRSKTYFSDFIDSLSSYHKVHSFELEYCIIYRILSEYCLRISEVLRIRISDCVAPNKIIIKLSKSKNYFVIVSKELYEIVFSYFKSYDETQFRVTYINFYRWMLKHYPESVITCSMGNRKVTHSFRYKEAKNFKSLHKTEKQIQALLKHASVKSQQYYLKNNS